MVKQKLEQIVLTENKGFIRTSDKHSVEVIGGAPELYTINGEIQNIKVEEIVKQIKIKTKDNNYIYKKGFNGIIIQDFSYGTIDPFSQKLWFRAFYNIVKYKEK